jgi:hypothetical protein
LPFPKLFGPCDTHFSRFQNRLGLATLILAVFKIVWPLRHSFWPFSKSFGPVNTLFCRFQNQLGLVTLIIAVFNIDNCDRHIIDNSLTDGGQFNFFPTKKSQQRIVPIIVKSYAEVQNAFHLPL